MTEPSKFWQALGAEHRRELNATGFEMVKRRQAFRYFNWNWRWRAVHKSEQFRFLLAHTSPVTWLRAAAARTKLSDEAWAHAPLGRTDRWLYSFAVRLLWEYARGRDTLGILELAEPEIGGLLPVEWQGRVISQDLANTALELASVARALALKGGRADRILEIGAGYGRTAYWLLSAFPKASYTIVDIEPALSVSEWYLKKLFPAERLRFIPADHLSSVGDDEFDLALSISSLHEMRPEQVAEYLRLLDRTSRIVFLKQWSRWHNPVDDVTLEFKKYPIPEHWSALFWEPCAVQTQFSQAAWCT